MTRPHDSGYRRQAWLGIPRSGGAGHTAAELQIFNRPIMYGVSNKSFIGNILNIKNPDKRVNGSVISSLFSIMNGVNIIRTHNVKETVEMIKLWKVFK